MSKAFSDWLVEAMTDFIIVVPGINKEAESISIFKKHLMPPAKKKPQKNRQKKKSTFPELHMEL